MDEELPLGDEQRKWFLEIKTTPGEDDVKIVEMTTKDLENYINLLGKAGVGLEKTDFERSFAMDKMLSHIIAYYRKIFHDRKSRSMQTTSLLFYLKKLLRPPQSSTPTTMISQQTSTSRQTLYQ